MSLKVEVRQDRRVNRKKIERITVVREMYTPIEDKQVAALTEHKRIRLLVLPLTALTKRRSGMNTGYPQEPHGTDKPQSTLHTSLREILEDFFYVVLKFQSTESFLIRQGKTAEALDSTLTSITDTIIKRVEGMKGGRNCLECGSQCYDDGITDIIALLKGGK